MLTRIMNDSVTGCFFVKNQIKSILAAEEIELSLKTSCFQNFKKSYLTKPGTITTGCFALAPS